MTSFPPINAESGFVAALLIGFLLVIIGHEIAGSLFMIAGVAYNYVLLLLVK
jgi:hypothetical protein